MVSTIRCVWNAAAESNAYVLSYERNRRVTDGYFQLRAQRPVPGGGTLE